MWSTIENKILFQPHTYNYTNANSQGFKDKPDRDSWCVDLSKSTCKLQVHKKRTK